MASSIVTAPLSSLTGGVERITFHEVRGSPVVLYAKRYPLGRRGLSDSTESFYNVAQLNMVIVEQLVIDAAGSKIETIVIRREKRGILVD